MTGKQRSLFDEATQYPAASFPSERVREHTAFVPLSELAPPQESCLPAPGIARMAAEAPEIDHLNEVEYRELSCRSLLSPCNSRRVPFDYTINPYRGCEFGCVYCYARYTHEYMELQAWLDFERKVFVKANAREALIEDLRKRDLKGKWIAIGAATDPYQPAERRYGITRSVLEVLSRRRNLRLSITTKSDLVRRDIDLLQEIRKHSEVHVNVTITTPHRELARRIEPRAPRPDKRFQAVRELSEAGVHAGVFLMPVLPRINDRLEDIEEMVRTALDAGASYFASNVLFLRKCSKSTFFPFIGERFPELLPYYQRMYARNYTEALTNYSRGKHAEIQAIKHRLGMPGFGGQRDGAFIPDQLALL
jgi:DNA repair photolyase